MDKVVHSAVGVGMYISAALMLFVDVMLTIYILISLVVIALLKEVYDYIDYGKFDWKDFTATLNPFVLIRWYREVRK